MRSRNWIFFVAARYLKERRTSRALAASFLSTAGIAVGVITLVVVIGVMNGFQLGFIEDILEIRSYDLRIDGLGLAEAQETAARLREDSRVRAAVAFLDTQTLAKGRFAAFEAVEIRGVPDGISALDPGLERQLDITEGALRPADGLVLGGELARALGVRLGDSVTLASLAGGGFAGLVPASHEYPVVGIFRSGFYEYDRGLAFTSLEIVEQLASGSDRPVVGIKLDNRYRLNGIVPSIREGLPEPEATVVSWREFNRAFFGALRMEKLTMSLLIGVMFLVVAGNIYHSLRRGVQEKRTAIAVLRALGAGSREIQYVFLFEGALIGMMGMFWGVTFGLLIVTHIETLFSLLELLSYWGASILNQVFGLQSAGGLAITPATFYLTEVPVRILPAEILLIAFFALSASVLSAWGASRDIAAMKPSTILRYE